MANTVLIVGSGPSGCACAAALLDVSPHAVREALGADAAERVLRLHDRVLEAQQRVRDLELAADIARRSRRARCRRRTPNY